MKLRKLEEKDADGMLEWMHDPEIQDFFCFDAMERTQQDAQEFIRNASTNFAESNNIHYAVCDDEDEYLGTISLKNIDLCAKKAEFAISLRKKARGRGVGQAAISILLDKAFAEFDLERVYLNVLSDNNRAIHLYEKCGFIYEGEFRKHIYIHGKYKSLKWYSILREEYFADKSHQKVESGRV